MNPSDQNSGHSAAYRIGRSMLGTVPIVLVGSMAVSMNMTGPVFAADHVQPQLKKPGVSPAPRVEIDLSSESLGQPDVHLAAATTTDGTIETASAPTTYRVVAGDTVSSIAGRYGLSTASVLALNGLSWKSTIYPGQTLHLTAARATSAPAPSAPSHSTASTYTIVRGDTLSAIAAHHGVSTQALLSANGLGLSSIIYPGQKLSIPGSSSTGSSAPHAAPAPTAAVSASTSGTYTIRTGDTLSSIAKAHHTTVEALLAANHLSWTSTIYAGKKLTIPGSAPAAVATASTGTAIPIVSSSLNATQVANARTIISVGRSLGVSDYGIVIALAAAAQESSLTNVTYGDRDSVGLFQQRPSQGWGTKAQLLNTTYAARLFFGGVHNPNAGRTRGLLDIPGWSRMTVTQAAQAVQGSAYPNAYAKWERPARIWVASL
jgi:N-acetylmuramoyl-L-alanine amidase